jgi:PAS domain S-box-containing protein
MKKQWLKKQFSVPNYLNKNGLKIFRQSITFSLLISFLLSIYIYISGYYLILAIYMASTTLIFLIFNILANKSIARKIQLEESILSLSRFSEECPYPILRISHQGEILYNNRSGNKLKDYIKSNYNRNLSCIIQSVISNNTQIEHEIVIDTTYYNVTLVPFNELKYINIYAHDITHKKKSEEELKYNEERFRVVSEAVGEFIWEIDQNKNIVFITDKVLEVIGYKADELIGKPYTLFLPDENKDQFINDIYIKINKRENINKYETQILHQTGKLIWVETSGLPYFDQSGQYRGYRGSTASIDERKKYEQQLDEARKHAEMVANNKAQFLSTMSHEIRTPMSAVIGLSNLLLSENPRPDQRENIETLQFSADTLLALINDILDFSKIEAGKISFESIDFNFYELLKGIRNIHKLRAQQKNVALNLDIDESIPEFLHGDSLRLSQVLNNLLSNAVKFTEKGEVNFSVFLKGRNNDEINICFSVKDTGIGIAENKLEEIFEGFTQASSDTSRKYGGTGLGLAISSRLLQLQNSQLEVKSKLGEGSVFYFVQTFREAKNNQIITKNIGSETENLDNVHILLVEDNPMNQIIARKFIEKWHAKISIANHGKQALEMMENQTFDLILMDLHMPIMDGFETSKLIRQNNKFDKNLPIIALTADAEDETKDKITDAGMNGILTKPFRPNELLSIINQFLTK